MVIYIYENGEWDYEWNYHQVPWDQAVRVDLDRLWSYKDLTPVQIKACEEALSE